MLRGARGRARRAARASRRSAGRGRSTPTAWRGSSSAFGPGRVCARRAAPPPPRAGGREPGAARPRRRARPPGRGHERRAPRAARAAARSSTCSPASARRRTLADAGRLLAENAERHLKPPKAMAALFADRPDLLRNAEALAERCAFTLEDLGYRFPDYPVPAGETQFSYLRQLTEAGARERYRPYHEKARAPARARARAHREARARRLLPDRLGHRALLPRARGSWSRAAARPPTAPSATPRHHRRRPGGDGAALRALPLRGARRVARHRPRPAERRPARAGDPVRLRALRRARRGDDRERHHLPRPERRARDRQGARDPAGRDRPARRGTCAASSTWTRATRWRRGSRARASTRDDRADARCSRASSSEIQDLPRHLGQHSGGMVIAQGGSTRWCRSSPPRCPGAWSCSGTRTTAPTSASSRSTCSASACWRRSRTRSRCSARAGRRVDLAHLPAGRPEGLRACCRRPTRSACSRSRAARRWRRCRA